MTADIKTIESHQPCIHWVSYIRKKSPDGSGQAQPATFANASFLECRDHFWQRIYGFNDGKDLLTCQHGLTAGDNGGRRESLALKIILSALGLLTAAIQDIGPASRRIGTLTGNCLFFMWLQQADATKDNGIVG